MNEYNIESTEMVDVGRFHIVKHILKLQDNKTQPYSYIQMKPGVVIVPIIDGKVVLIRQYRLTIDSWEWEFPAGVIDEGESQEQAAVRELKEETGYLAGKVTNLGFCYASQGSTNEKNYLYAIECTTKKEMALDGAEKIEVHLLNEEDVDSMIDNDIIHHSMGIVAWHKYKSAKDWKQ